jgi:hypothetical protein
MILEKQSQAHVLQEGEKTQESIGMSLDLDSAQILMQMLSKNLYSDDIGSTIRECASNALDSHRRAGTTDPIIVSFQIASDNNNYEFTVEDFGIGLDADDVKNIISKYGKSTKRDSANELGMMGLGFKAPLAYSSSFYFVARKNGVERKYMMYEGEDVNTIDLLYETPTMQRNGVKIIVPVSYYDRSQFYTKIREQLAYFENVYFNVNDIDNNFVINRHELFQWSPLASDRNLHVCLDNVYYPLDFKKLGIDTISFPVALRLGLSDGVFPTPNRESLRYTKEAIAVIIKKIKDVANYFVERYNESVKDTENILEAIDHYRSSARFIKLKKDGGNLNIGELKAFATVPFASPKVKGLDYHTVQYYSTLKDYLIDEYEIVNEVYRGKWAKASRWSRTADRVSNPDNTIYVYTDRLSGIKKEYLKCINERGCTEYVVKKHKSYKLGGSKDRTSGYDSYYKILELWKFPKSDWRNVIKEFQEMQSRIFSRFIDLDNYVVPEQFILSRKKTTFGKNGVTGPKQRRQKLEGEVTGKLASSLERSVNNQNCKFVPEVVQMKDAHKAPYLTVYGSSVHTLTFDMMFSVYHPKKGKVRFIVFSERELTRLKDIDLHNWIHIDKFMEGKHIAFKRVVTAYLIDQLITDYRSVFDRTTRMEHISTDLRNKMVELAHYRDTNHMNGSDKLYKTMLEVAEADNLFDMSIYPLYLEIKSVFGKLPFINSMFMASRSYNVKDGMTDAIRDLFKYYKQRIDWKHYNIRINEEVVTPVAESEIEELI